MTDKKSSEKPAKQQETPFAVVRSGGKQYLVQEGDVIDLDCAAPDEGENFDFSEVLALFKTGQWELGTPSLEGKSIKGEILGPIKGPKVIAYKFKRRKNFHKKKGHRQNYLRVRVGKI